MITYNGHYRLAKRTLILFIFCLFYTGKAYCAPAITDIKIFVQDDGTEIRAKKWGDEWSHGWETDDGYTIVYDKLKHGWTYASNGAGGSLISSSKLVGIDQPDITIKKNIRLTGTARAEIITIKESQTNDRGARSSGPGYAPVTGVRNIPVILVNFSDTTTTYSQADFENTLFATGNNSAKDYYEEVSNGVFSISSGPSGILGWVNAPETHDYYGSNNANGKDVHPAELTRYAVSQVDSTVNFADYDSNGDCFVDSVGIIHQGNGEETGSSANDIWSHQWSLNAAKYSKGDGAGTYDTNDTAACGTIKVDTYIITAEILYGAQHTIGVFAHEYGHALGLPDLYDTDATSSGIGSWGLMGAGAWNRNSGSGARSGDSPAHLEAWSKYKLGWVTPTIVTISLFAESIQAVENSTVVYQVLNGSAASASGEYFLIENRNRTGFDIGLPVSGLAVWHIDESKSSNTTECYAPSDCAANHYKVSLEQADGQSHLEKNSNRGDAGDLFPGSSNQREFSNTTTPNTKLYNGSESGFSISNISNSGSFMTADIIIADTIPSVTITTLSLPTGKTGVPYSQQISKVGGVTPYAWSISSRGTLPFSFNIDSTTGVLSGTPATYGTYTFTVMVQDGNAITDTQELSLTIRPAVTIITTSLLGGIQGIVYSRQLTAVNGTTPYSWTVTVGSLPAGLVLNAVTGVISGIPTTYGTYTFTVMVQDSNAITDTQVLSLTILPAVTITTTSLPKGVKGIAYSSTLKAASGTLPYSGWTVTVGKLPASLVLNAATGEISGKPAMAGTSTFTVRVQDSKATTDTQVLTIIIIPPVTIPSQTLPQGVVKVPYKNTTLKAVNGTAPYSWTVTAGILPPGLVLNAAGVISGTPTTTGHYLLPGNYKFTVKVRDSNGNTDTRALTITIIFTYPVNIYTTSLIRGVVGVPYNRILKAEDGTKPYSWGVAKTSLPLPPGLTVNAEGILSGIPAKAGLYTFTVQVWDSNKVSDTQILTLRILP